MDEFLKSLEIIRERELKRYSLDKDCYAAQITDILQMKDKLDHNAIRVELAKHYIRMLKWEMGDALVKAGIFGSVSRNEAHLGSDVDILLFTHHFSSEEKKLQNAPDRVQERGGVVNFAYNSHRICELESLLTKETGIQVNSMRYRYNKDDYEAILKELGSPIMLL